MTFAARYLALATASLLLSLVAAAAVLAASAQAAPGEGFLPHDRAWELVSPPAKNGGNVAADSGRTRAAVGGGAVGFSSLTAFGDARGTGVATDYMAVRSGDPDPGSNGWVTHALTPELQPNSFQQLLSRLDPLYVGEFSADLDRGVFFSPTTPLTDDPDVEAAQNLYVRQGLRTPGPGAFQLLTACPLCATTGPLAPAPNPGGLAPKLAWATPGFDRVLFESEYELTADTPAFDGVRVFEWSAAEGVRLAGRIPVAPATSCDDVAGPACVAAEASMAGPGAGTTNGETHSPSLTPRTVSDGSDGHSRVFVTHPTNKTGTATQTSSSEGNVYMRVDGQETVQLNVSERTPSAPYRPAQFLDASVDGRRAFFMSTAMLTDNAPVPGGKLYMYDAADVNDETQRLTVSATAGEYRLAFGGETTADIAFDAPAETVEAALEALPSIGGAGGSVRVTGGPGDETASSPYTIVFGGALGGADQPLMTTAAGTTPLSGGSATATVTGWLMGGGRLTLVSADHHPADFGVLRAMIGAGEDGRHVYLAATGQLVAGAPTLGSHVGFYHWHDGEITFIGSAPFSSIPFDEMKTSGVNYELLPRQARVTPDGRFMLFNSWKGEGLTGYDHGALCNASVGCRQLYVYSADSETLQCASCNPSGTPATVDATTLARQLSGGSQTSWHEPRNLSDDGRFAFFSTAEKLVVGDTNGVSDAYVFDAELGEPYLLSTGKDTTPSYFLDASGDGRDAFFVTREALSGWDVDSSFDLYSARVGGGFPEPPPAEAPCQGDACQGAGDGPPVSGAPGSGTFVGAGNRVQAAPSAARCARLGRGAKRSRRRVARLRHRLANAPAARKRAVGRRLRKARRGARRARAQARRCDRQRRIATSGRAGK